MSNSVSKTSLWADRDYHRVLWLTLALFLSYLSVATSLPVTSIYVSVSLGYGSALAGLAVGIPFATTIITRGMAGRMSDHQGSKQCMLRGLWTYTAAGVISMAATWSALPPGAALAVLVAGRLLLGLGESLTVVGLLTWCLGIMGPKRAGAVLALVGMALFGAFAVGSPIGLALFNRAGFGGVMAACALAPMAGLAMVLPVAAVAPHAGNRPSFWRIIGRFWELGLVVCFQGVGFAAIGAFMPLLFLARGWPGAGLGLSCFGGAFVLVRILGGNLPDRIGGITVALASIAVEAAGQYLLWAAPGPELALAGAALTGLGCSLVFPAMGIEMVRRIPPHLRGTAMGGLAAFQDLAFGGTGPITGLLAQRFGYDVVFLVGGLAATVGLGLVVAVARAGRAPAEPSSAAP